VPKLPNRAEPSPEIPESKSKKKPELPSVPRSVAEISLMLYLKKKSNFLNYGTVRQTLTAPYQESIIENDMAISIIQIRAPQSAGKNRSLSGKAHPFANVNIKERQQKKLLTGKVIIACLYCPQFTP